MGTDPHDDPITFESDCCSYSWDPPLQQFRQGVSGILPRVKPRAVGHLHGRSIANENLLAEPLLSGSDAAFWRSNAEPGHGLKKFVPFREFGAIRTASFLVEPDIEDWFLCRGQQHLDAAVRQGISTFANGATFAEVERGCEMLRQNIDSGEIVKIIQRNISVQGESFLVCCGGKMTIRQDVTLPSASMSKQRR